MCLYTTCNKKCHGFEIAKRSTWEDLEEGKKVEIM